MKQHEIVPVGICRLPRAIWIPSSHPVAVYRGTPVEIVRQMSCEMDPANLSVRETVYAISVGLEKNRGIAIQVPLGTSDEVLAALFVQRLLDCGLGQPLPTA
jgi:hypothetical protein